MSKSLKRVRQALEAAGVTVDILEMAEGTRTAADAAAAAGCALDQIAKSIIYRAETTGDAVLFITAGGNRVCDAKASALAGEPLGKADAALIRAQTGFAIGGVSPLGHVTPIRAWYDPRLMAFDRVYAAAGTPRHLFPIAPRCVDAAGGRDRGRVYGLNRAPGLPLPLVQNTAGGPRQRRGTASPSALFTRAGRSVSPTRPPRPPAPPAGPGPCRPAPTAAWSRPSRPVAPRRPSGPPEGA